MGSSTKSPQPNLLLPESLKHAIRAAEGRKRPFVNEMPRRLRFLPSFTSNLYFSFVKEKYSYKLPFLCFCSLWIRECGSLQDQIDLSNFCIPANRKDLIIILCPALQWHKKFLVYFSNGEMLALFPWLQLQQAGEHINNTRLDWANRRLNLIHFVQPNLQIIYSI